MDIKRNPDIPEDEPFLIFYFQHFKFEFIRDKIIATDLFLKRKYKIELIPYDEIPFMIQLIER